MFKNTAGQKWAVFAFQDEGGTNPGEPVTGDAANITANLRLDGGAANAVDDVNPTELEDGVYIFDITQAESNADNIVIAPASSTANVNVIGLPAALYTRTDVSGVEAKIDTIDGIADAILIDTAEIGAAGAGLTALATQASLDVVDGIVDAILIDTGATLDAAITAIDTKVTDIQGATFDTATDSLEALRNRGDAAWTGAPPTVHTGTAQAGATNTITLDVGASAVDNLYTLLRVSITSGTGVGQTRAIKAYNGTTKVATTINDWVVIPDNTSGFEIVSDSITEIIAAPTAAAVADAVWNESTTGHTTAGTFGEQLKNDVDAILVDTSTTLQNAITTIDGIVDAILADTNELQTDDIPGTLATLATAAALATVDTVVDGIQTDLDNATDGLGAIKAAVDLGATAAALATVDTVVDAIKVQTDQLLFTNNNVHVNLVKIAGGADLAAAGAGGQLYG